ncbi:MAG: DoxX family membrane protein [Gemmatimonadetes bacterium]|nr:DoxX family membrane protein [Gemmatimonadota bacterium]
MEILHLVGRVLFGGYFIFNAMGHLVMYTDMMTDYSRMKGVPAPRLAVYLTGLLLLVGGLTILLGYEPEWGVAALALFFLGVTFKMHDFWNQEGEARMYQMLFFMRNVALLGASLMLLALPEPWPYSLGY